MSHPKLIILGRDGILNEDREDYVKSAEEWVPIHGALEAVARLNHAGWHTVVATNQSGLGRGLFDMAALNEMHLKMNALLAKQGGRIDAVFICPHTPEEGCHCRKPLPGLFEQIGERWGIDLAQAIVVGDSLAELQAAAAVGCQPHLLRTGKAAALDEAHIEQICRQIPKLQVHDDLTAFAEHLIQHERDVRGVGGRSDSGFGRLD